MTDFSVNLDETFDTIAHSLLQRVKSRDEEAWDRLVHLYSPLVYRWCRKSGLKPDAAADVGQEVFVAVARKVSDFRRDAESGSFRGWLCTITKNKVRDYWRASGRQPENMGSAVADQAEADGGPLPALENSDDELRLLFRRVVDFVRGQFSEQDWRAFWRMTVDQVPARKVAEELQCSRNSVYLARSRIMRQIRSQFGQHGL